MKADKSKLQLAMVRAVMNTADICGATGMPRPTINRVISGRNARPATIGKICKALNVDPAEIIAS